MIGDSYIGQPSLYIYKDYALREASHAVQVMVVKIKRWPKIEKII